MKPRIGSTIAPSSEQSFFFYQAVDGQHIYLHPLDIRVLLAEYKSYAAFPQLLDLTIEGAEEGTSEFELLNKDESKTLIVTLMFSSVNDDLRRRCKYLAHLPTGCAITFIQVDLTRHVSKSTLAQFEAPLRQRRQRRKEKGKKEEREKKKAEEREKEEEELQRMNLSRDHSFPVGWGSRGSDDFEEALERSLWEVEEGTDPSPALHPSASAPSLVSNSNWSGRSFASTINTSGGTQSWGRSRPAYGNSQVDEEEVAALWKRFESTQDRKRDGGSATSGGAGESSSAPAGTPSEQQGSGRKGKKAKGQKLLLTGGGRGF